MSNVKVSTFEISVNRPDEGFELQVLKPRSGSSLKPRTLGFPKPKDVDTLCEMLRNSEVEFELKQEIDGGSVLLVEGVYGVTAFSFTDLGKLKNIEGSGY